MARHAIREEVLRTAWTIFSRQGFEATTIDQIAAAAGMSRRTFFRYFASKDELMIERLVSAGAQIAEMLAARPAGESPWRSLRAAFGEAIAAQDRSPAAARTLGRVLRDEPAARANMEERRRRWLELFTPLIAARLGGGSDSELRATALASAGVACLDAAQAAWIERPGASLGGLLDLAMSAVAPVD